MEFVVKFANTNYNHASKSIIIIQTNFGTMTMVYDEQNEWYILENKYTLGKPVKFMSTSVGLTF